MNIPSIFERPLPRRRLNAMRAGAITCIAQWRAVNRLEHYMFLEEFRLKFWPDRILAMLSYKQGTKYWDYLEPLRRDFMATTFDGTLWLPYEEKHFDEADGLSRKTFTWKPWDAFEPNEILRTKSLPLLRRRLPFMGAKGCVVPPHLRPLCTLHVCSINSFGCDPKDADFTAKYFKLRRQIDRVQ